MSRICNVEPRRQFRGHADYTQVSSRPDQHRMDQQLKIIAVIVLTVILSSGCTSIGSRAGTSRNVAERYFTEDEKHRLYSAALAASDSPMDTDTFPRVCRTIGIFDQDGKPNDRYMAFVSEHIVWGTNSETEPFREEINSKDKATKYIKQHLPAW
jgi:hypothetical protein